MNGRWAFLCAAGASRPLKGIMQRMDSLKLVCGKSNLRLKCNRVIWKRDSLTAGMYHLVGSTGTEFKLMGERLISDAQEIVGGVKLLPFLFLFLFFFFPASRARRERQVASDVERMMDGIFVFF